MNVIQPTPITENVVLRGLEHGNVFWSTYHKGDDPTRLIDGTVAYEVLAYTNTDEEAIEIWKTYNPLFAKELIR